MSVSQALATLLVTGAPTRTTRSGEYACAKPSTRSSASYVDTAFRPVRSPDSGSAIRGQPAARANASATPGSTPAPHPATTRPRGCARTSAAKRAASAAAGSRCAGDVRIQGAPPARPGVSNRSAPVGTSGSRKGRLRCTGPAGGPDAYAAARLASARQRLLASEAASVASGGPGSWNQRTALPKSPDWSIVWPAPQSRNSAGRSAVHTSKGTRAWCASTTAGWRFAAAVPEVQHTIAGRALARPMPSARKAAERSSSTTSTCTRSSRASASVSGVFRDPGETTAAVTPLRTHSSTRVSANDVVASRSLTAPQFPDERAKAEGGARPGLHPDGCVVAWGETDPRGDRPRGRARRTRARDVRRYGDRDRRTGQARGVRRLFDGRAARVAAGARPTRARYRLGTRQLDRGHRRRGRARGAGGVRRSARAIDRARGRRAVPRALARAAVVRNRPA